MPSRRPVTTALADSRGVVVRADALAGGLARGIVDRDVTAGRLTAAHRGVYLVPEAADSRPARLRAALAHLGPQAVAVVEAAADVHGLDGTPARAGPRIAVPRGQAKRQRAGITLHFWDLPAAEVTVVDGVRVTTIARTLADVCRLLPRYEAVAIVDSALHRGAIALDDLAAVAELMRRRPGGPAGRRVLAQARFGAQSPLETRVRLRASDAGYPPDALQVPVRDDEGRLIGFGDIGYELPGGGWLIVEADGRSVHEAPAAVLHDRRRQNALLAQPGIVVVRVTWADTRNARTIPTQIAPILQRAGWRPAPAPRPGAPPRRR